MGHAVVIDGEQLLEGPLKRRVLQTTQGSRLDRARLLLYRVLPPAQSIVIARVALTTTAPWVCRAEAGVDPEAC